MCYNPQSKKLKNQQLQTVGHYSLKENQIMLLHIVTQYAIVFNNFPTQSESDLNSSLWTPRLYKFCCPPTSPISHIHCLLLSNLTHTSLKCLEYVKLTPTSWFLYLLFPLLRILLFELFTKLVLPQTDIIFSSQFIITQTPSLIYINTSAPLSTTSSHHCTLFHCFALFLSYTGHYLKLSC